MSEGHCGLEHGLDEVILDEDDLDEDSVLGGDGGKGAERILDRSFRKC